jgi:hypothetical protein
MKKTLNSKLCTKREPKQLKFRLLPGVVGYLDGWGREVPKPLFSARE